MRRGVGVCGWGAGGVCVCWGRSVCVGVWGCVGGVRVGCVCVGGVRAQGVLFSPLFPEFLAIFFAVSEGTLPLLTPDSYTPLHRSKLTTHSKRWLKYNWLKSWLIKMLEYA